LAAPREVGTVKSVETKRLDIEKKEELLAQLGVSFEFSSLDRRWYPFGHVIMAVDRGAGGASYWNLTAPIKTSTRAEAIERTFNSITHKRSPLRDGDAAFIEDSGGTFRVSWDGRGWTLHAGKLPEAAAPSREVPAPRGIERGAQLGIAEKEAFLAQVGLDVVRDGRAFYMEGRLARLDGMLSIGYNPPWTRRYSREEVVEHWFDELTAERPVRPKLLRQDNPFKRGLGPGEFVVTWDGRGWSLLQGEMPPR
jgi:hypothetical protein